MDELAKESMQAVVFETDSNKSKVHLITVTEVNNDNVHTLNYVEKNLCDSSDDGNKINTSNADKRWTEIKPHGECRLITSKPM